MNFAEYQSPETIEIVTTWGQTVLVVAGVVAAMGAFMRWVGKRWDHRIEVIAERRDDALAERLTLALDRAVQAMSDRIDQRTQPIQRDANGGNSLPDVFARIDALDSRLVVLAAAATPCTQAVPSGTAAITRLPAVTDTLPYAGQSSAAHNRIRWVAT